MSQTLVVNTTRLCVVHCNYKYIRYYTVAHCRIYFVIHVYCILYFFFQVASATATRFGLSRGLLGLQYDQINESESVNS